MTTPSDRSGIANGTIGSLAIPVGVVGLRLHKIVREELIACEAVRFDDGATAVETVLRRAAISGRVDRSDVKDHFADLLDDDGSLVDTITLDAKSYRALKNRWAKCRLEKLP